MTRTELDAIRARNVRTTRHSWMQADADRRALLAYVEELRAAYGTGLLAIHCRRCVGTGEIRIGHHDMPDEVYACPDCADIREVLP